MKKGLKKAKEKTGRLVDRVLHSSRPSSRSQSPAPDNPNLNPAPPNLPPTGLPTGTASQLPQTVVAKPTAFPQQLATAGVPSSPFEDRGPIPPAPVSYPHDHPAATTKQVPDLMSESGQVVGRLLPTSDSSSRLPAPAPVAAELLPAPAAAYFPGPSEELKSQPASAVDAEAMSVPQASQTVGLPPTSSDGDLIPPTHSPIGRDYIDTQDELAETAAIIASSDTALKRDDLPSTVLPDHRLVIVSNNQNMTYNYGRDVFNNNSVTNNINNPITNIDNRVTQNVYHTKAEEDFMKVIKAAMGNRFVPTALHEMQSEEAGCMPGTRTRVLSLFMEWVRSDPMRIFWLAGLAGTGKTSIAVTLCRMLQEDPDVLLGGAFFCSRTANINERTDARCIVPTLAAALGKHSKAFATALVEVLEADSDVALKPIGAQITALLQQPLVTHVSPTRPIVFVVDALDECSDEGEVKKLLKAISTLICDTTIKFILTSRPETHISTSPISNTDRNSILRLHTMDTGEVTEDIRLCINHAFVNSPLDKPWYSDADVHTLAELSGGLFIFASTIISYVLKASSVKGRANRLQTALSAVQDSKVALGPLDSMYDFIVTRASHATEVEPKELETSLRVLACIITARMPLSIRALADLLELDTDELRESLQRLQAVVHVPQEVDQPTLRTLHASFGDYLFARRRITTFLGDETLATGCLRVMHKGLYFNVSRSRSSYEPNPATRHDSISLSLEYACIQWSSHITALNEPSMLDNEIDQFFCPGLLYWLEVMSVLGRLSRAAAMLYHVKSTVKLVALSKFLRDAHGFVASSQEAIERSATHIYLSALPFAAKDSLVYQTFMPFFIGLISVETFGIDRHGGRLVMTLTGHKNKVKSIAYSPDGILIASGSEDGSLRIWDTRSGDIIMSLLNAGYDWVNSVAFASDGKSLAAATTGSNMLIWNVSVGRWSLRRPSGQSYGVNCVKFSPDGSLLASAGSDKTVRLWKAGTGEQVLVMEGHHGEVTAVAFSPVSEVLASGSADEEIRLWHSATGEPIAQPLRGHIGWIYCVSFHPDGLTLASGSADRDIRLWNTQTEECIATLHGHSSSISSIQFSPDGRALVSAGRVENTVRLWTIQGDATETSSITFEGHSDNVNCVTFSPDGLYIASASSDGTIRIWDAGNGKVAVQPLQAQSGRVNSVALSSDGEFIVSGSHDHYVYVRDTQSGEPRLPPLLGHIGPVYAVAASPDNSLIASSSSDCTIRLWDVHTGASSGEPLLGHNDKVDALAFSSDGRWLSSGSDDTTVCIWDVATRQTSSIGPMRCVGPVHTVAFSPDTLFVAAGDSRGRIYFWNMDTGQPKREPFHASDRFIFSIAFSLTGTYIASGGADGVGRVWNIGTGEQILALEGHSDFIRSIVFSPNGQFIGTGADDRTVRLWSATTGVQLAMMHGHDHYVMSVVFTSEGQSIVSCSFDSTIRIWDVEAALLQASNNGNDHITALASTKLKNGWLMGPSGELLLWVPVDYRAYLCVPRCTMIIGRHRVVVSAVDGPLHRGENWTNIWRGTHVA